MVGCRLEPTRRRTIATIPKLTTESVGTNTRMITYVCTF